MNALGNSQKRLLDMLAFVFCFFIFCFVFVLFFVHSPIAFIDQKNHTLHQPKHKQMIGKTPIYIVLSSMPLSFDVHMSLSTLFPSHRSSHEILLRSLETI